jgi:hypothetical protein
MKAADVGKQVYEAATGGKKGSKNKKSMKIKKLRIKFPNYLFKKLLLTLFLKIIKFIKNDIYLYLYK